MPSPQRVTALLDEWSHGDRASLDELVPLVEAELHRLARRHMSRERRKLFEVSGRARLVAGKC